MDQTRENRGREIWAGSPADEAGTAGFLIDGINGAPVSSVQDVYDALNSAAPGQRLSLHAYNIDNPSLASACSSQRRTKVRYIGLSSPSRSANRVTQGERTAHRFARPPRNPNSGCNRWYPGLKHVAFEAAADARVPRNGCSLSAPGILTTCAG